jgi:hypothetical protein
MTVLSRGPVFVSSAPASLAPDPLTCLLEQAYQMLAPVGPAARSGLLVASDGSKIGQRRVFHLAAKRGGKIPPKLIPFRLSNGPSSFLAIAHGHSGRVLTFADGESSLPRALAYADQMLRAEIGPPSWVVLAGEASEIADPVRGWAFAVELRRG